jgi:hypothetical protein
MPTYIFRNTETDEVSEIFLKLAEREEYLKSNPHLVQVITPPAFKYNNAGKPDDSFRDVLKKIKSEHPRGDVNTFD